MELEMVWRMIITKTGYDQNFVLVWYKHFTLLKPNKTRKVKQKHVGQRDFLSCRDVLIFYKGRVKF